MLDRLEALLDRFPLSAHLLEAAQDAPGGPLLAAPAQPVLHLLRGGSVCILPERGEALRIDVPSLVLFARAQPHHLQLAAGTKLDRVTAAVHFEAGAGNPVAEALPSPVCLPLAALMGGEALLEVLFDEAFTRRCGRQVLLERLLEAVLIQLLRTLMEGGQIQIGLLAGMGHPRLRHALVAMHEHPAQDWSLQALAERAGMSRSAFAESFRAVIGSTPGHYLQLWRTRLVQQALRRGHPLKRIASEVGYGSEAALSRAFKAQTGQSPRQWKQAGQRTASGR